ncbi:TrkH family potassium uptake protein [Glycomyces luteolus]|uniref:TrkH family potassium uptake protein n=1 Tax=Glycomyces luteolus TaxID=2670330 RepID=A0A9X3SR90_9ACTN|nr:potassium transporter TrkG [Glycomyces luteolus]MDA1361392.1 TrkH family potassium uptake protein [Glycomyces luteolus]
MPRGYPASAGRSGAANSRPQEGRVLQTVLRAILDGFIRQPVRIVPVAFAAGILAATGLLMLPVAQADPGSTRFVDALFTATSAIAVTGLVTVDTPTHWSGFGEAVILGCMQLGGLGIMTTAAFLGMLVSRKLRLRSKLMTQAELHPSISLGDVRSVLRFAMLFTLVVEGTFAAILALRFHFAYDLGAGEATWHGVFHSVAAFNNAGFALYSDSIIGFATDPWISLPLAFGTVLGGLGIPVVYELLRRRSQLTWSLHTKMTLAGTAVLLFGGWLVLLALEWSNPGTFGQFAWHERFLPAFFQSAVLRTSGFNSIDVGQLNDDSLLVSMVLMFIGGGSASTAGGIKVTTFFMLMLVIWAEIRGERDASAFRRSLPMPVVREALTVALVYLALNVVAVMLMQRFEPDIMLAPIMFEVVSAAATVGQSTGITYDLGDPSKWLLAIVMYGGRIGPVLFATSLAMATRKRLYRYPETRPLVG